MIVRDAMHMLRQMRRNPGFTLMTLALLGLGIGATTAVYGLVRGVVLRPLPFGDARNLVVVWEDLLREGNHTFSVTPSNFRDIRERTTAFSEVAAQQTGGGFTIRDEQQSEVVRAGIVTGNYFHVMRVGAALGRTLQPEDERARAKVVVLSDALWRRRYGADPHIIGRTVSLDNSRYTVVGVMGPDFDAPWVFKAPELAAALWTPLEIPSLDDRTSAMYQVIARLRPGSTALNATSQLAVLSRDLENKFPDTNKDVAFNVVPMHDQIVGRVQTPLMLLLASIAFLLLIACANLASLLLQRTLARKQELAVRLAIGASRTRLVRQLVTENSVIALLGGALGAAIGVAGTRLLVSLAPPDTPRLTGIHFDRTTLAFSAATTAAVAIGLAFAALLQISKNAGAQLRAPHTRRTEAARDTLAFFQVMLAVTLLIAGGLFVRSFALLTAVDPGFATHNVVTLRVAAPDSKYATADEQTRLFSTLATRIESLPHVLTAGFTSRPPLDPPYGFAPLTVQGSTTAAGDAPLVGYRVVTPDYLQALDVPVRTGRSTSQADNARAPNVVVINEALARKVFPGESPIGKRVAFGDTNWVEIVGVAGDMNNGSISAGSAPEVFVPFAQSPVTGATLVVRTDGAAGSVMNDIRAAIRAIDADIATQDAATMDDLAAASIALPRFSAFLVSTFAALALLLAAIGVYAIFAHAVTTRTREIGIRSALGATSFRLLTPIVSRGLAIALAGTAAGAACALALSRVLQSQLFGVVATDAATYVDVVLAMAVVALIACAAPARRALRTNPAVALRAQ